MRALSMLTNSLRIALGALWLCVSIGQAFAQDVVVDSGGAVILTLPQPQPQPEQKRAGTTVFPKRNAAPAVVPKVIAKGASAAPIVLAAANVPSALSATGAVPPVPATAAAKARPKPTPPPAGAAEPPKPAAAVAATQPLAIGLPLTLNGRYLGDVAAEVSRHDAPVRIDTVRFLALVENEVAPEVFQSIKTRIGDALSAPLEVIRGGGVDLSYDTANIQLVLTVAQSAAKIRDFAIQPKDGDASLGTIDAPGFAAAITVSAAQTYDHMDDKGFEGFRAAFRSFASYGGAAGAALIADFRFDGDDGTWARENTVLIHDDVENAIRYSLGDVTPGSGQSTLSVPMLGGISIERRYREIKPLENVRASGRNRVTIERRSTVEIFVNGALSRTVILQPGVYDISDFPLSSGFNDIVLILTDDAGRRSEYSFQAFSSSELLDAGIFNFGVALGAAQIQGDASISYGDTLIGTAYAEFGVSDWLTLGLTGQAAEEFWAGGINGTAGTGIGILSVQAEGSAEETGNQGFAIGAQFRTSSGEEEGAWRWALDLDYQYASRFFETLDAYTARQDAGSVFEPISLAHRARARLSFELPWSMNASASASHARNRDDRPDRTVYGLTLSRAFDRIGVTASFERDEAEAADPENRVLFGLTYRFEGEGQFARASYDSADHTTALEYNRAQANTVDTWGLRAGLRHSDEESSAVAALSYVGNRFEAAIDHDVVAQDLTSGVVAQQTRVSAAASLAFAGGQVAVGRPLSDGFVIVDGHDALEGAAIEIREGRGGEKPIAETDWLGPALVPLKQNYQPVVYPTDISEAPAGADIGAGQFVVSAPLRAGYAHVTGSVLAATIIGRLLDEQGQPMALVSGYLEPEGHGLPEKILFFTNRTGRLVASNVPPGRYRVMPTGRVRALTTITVPADARGMTDLGVIKP